MKKRVPNLCYEVKTERVYTCEVPIILHGVEDILTVYSTSQSAVDCIVAASSDAKKLRTSGDIMILVWHRFSNTGFRWASDRYVIDSRDYIFRYYTKNDAENGHTYIQHMFPTNSRSTAQPSSPYLSDKGIDGFRDLLQDTKGYLLYAFRFMQRMWQFPDPKSHELISIDSNLLHKNHNQNRVSRMLSCAIMLGFGDVAYDFVNVLVNNMTQSTRIYNSLLHPMNTHWLPMLKNDKIPTKLIFQKLEIAPQQRAEKHVYQDRSMSNSESDDSSREIS